jgi:4-methylaminobutanoate oxidase (formaldehyde-forming)
MLTLKESKPGEPLMLHDEPIYLDGKIIGRTTSGNYSFNFNKNLAFGYVKIDEDLSALKNNQIEIEIEKTKYKAEILSKSLNIKDYKNI